LAHSFSSAVSKSASEQGDSSGEFSIGQIVQRLGLLDLFGHERGDGLDVAHRIFLAGFDNGFLAVSVEIIGQRVQ
jgi:hypothetical protein